MIEFDFLCVQPVAFPTDVTSEVLGRRVNMDLLTRSSLAKKDHPDWLRPHPVTKRFMESFFMIEVAGLPSADALIGDVRQRLSGLKDEVLAEAIDPSSADIKLLFDVRFNYLLILYEFTFRVDSPKKLDALLDYDDGTEFKNSLYNELRSLFVLEDDTSELGDWVSQSRSACITTAREILGKCLKVEFQEDSLLVYPNTGNISFFVKGLAGEADRESIEQRLGDLNRYAEKTASGSQSFYTGDRSSYLFGGRFHTISLTNLQNLNRYKLIQFHMQYMWFYLLRVYGLIDRMNRLLVDIKTANQHSRLVDELQPLITNVELLAVYDEGFKVAIENSHEEVYQKLQDRWNVEGALAGTKRAIEFLRGHLSDLINERQFKLSRRLNIGLTFISILQVFALISVWADYTNLTGSTPWHRLFGDAEGLRTFNLYLPLLLTLVFGALAVILIRYRRRRRRQRKLK